jgi:hypothetical protein
VSDEPDSSPLAARLPLKRKLTNPRPPVPLADAPTEIQAEVRPVSRQDIAAAAPAVTPAVTPAEVAGEDEVGTGPFALPPKVTKQAPRHAPPPAEAFGAPAQLLPPAPVTAPSALPHQPSPTTSGSVSETAPRAGGESRSPTLRTETATVLMPAGVPAQRTSPPAPPAAKPRRRRQPPRPSVSLPALVVLALATSFFAWISAEPFWLAVGHGHTGTATLIPAPGGCRASFVADDGSFKVSSVAVGGLRACPEGATAPGQMVSEKSGRVYITDAAGLHARWSIGFGLVLLCGLGIAAATGGGRLPGWRGTTAAALSLAAPALVTVVMLALAY